MSHSHRANPFASALALVFACAPAFAVNVTIALTGNASDSSTGAVLSGAELTLRQGGTTLGSAMTDADGQFRLSFDIANQPQAANLKLEVKRESFVPQSLDVVVASGRASKTSFQIQLFPKALDGCNRKSPHMIVVGYFRPASGSVGDPDIASRVADALDRDLLPRMQQSPGPKSAPSVIACGAAKPRAAADTTQLAKVLNADAFLTGSVDNAALTKVKVNMTVADQLGLLSPPRLSSSKDVNLEDAQESRLDITANKDILIALAGGYEKAGKFEECVDFTSAAARILGSLPSELAAARQRCQQRVPNRGLTAGGSP